MDFFKTKKVKTVEPEKDYTKIIEQIHNEFYTEVDRLLKFANIKQSTKSDQEPLLNKASKLRELGFSSAKSVVSAEEEESRISKIENENNKKERLINAINHFSMKYPNYKFITEDSVKKICKKYGLVYGSVERYVGDVPDKNIDDIENFKIDEKDAVYAVTYDGWSAPSEFITDEDYTYYTHHENATVEETGFKIVAPLSDFNMDWTELDDYEIVDKKIEIPDPIVLKPVGYNYEKYYLIVTAWGPEASDELVVNEKLN